MELSTLLALAIFLTRGLSSALAIPEPQAHNNPPALHLRDVALPGQRTEPTNAKPTNTQTRTTSTLSRPTPPPVVKACTTTTSQTANPCTLMDGVETMYPSTTTLYREVDCHGCAHIRVEQQLWYCPMIKANGRTTVHTASTTVSTVCKASTYPTLHPFADGDSDDAEAEAASAAGMVSRRRAQEAQQADGEEQGAGCPTTFVVQPEKSAGSTSTQYQQWATSTMRLNCGGCPLVISTALAGYGPAGRFTATVTVPVGFKTVYACQ